MADGALGFHLYDITNIQDICRCGNRHCKAETMRLRHGFIKAITPGAGTEEWQEQQLYMSKLAMIIAYNYCSGMREVDLDLDAYNLFKVPTIVTIQTTLRMEDWNGKS